MGAESFRPTETSETTTSTEVPDNQKVNNGITTIKNLRGGARQPSRRNTAPEGTENGILTRPDGTEVPVSRRFGGSWRTAENKIIMGQEDNVRPDTAENTTAAPQLNTTRTEAPTTEVLPQPETPAENTPITRPENLRGGARQPSRRNTAPEGTENGILTRPDGTEVPVSRRFGGSWRTAENKIIMGQEDNVRPDTAENTTAAPQTRNGGGGTPKKAENTETSPQTPSTTPIEEAPVPESGFRVVTPTKPTARVIPRFNMNGERTN